MVHKTRISGANYSVTGGKTRVGGTNYSIAGGRTRVSGTNYKISFQAPVVELSTLPVGSSVFVPRTDDGDSVNTEFLVVHQGNPDASMYSGGGTWLLSKTSLGRGSYSSGPNLLSEIDTDISGNILSITKPAIKNAYSGGTGGTESDKIFKLSASEVGYKDLGYGSSLKDGAVLSYFKGFSGTMSVGGYPWWLRSPVLNFPAMHYVAASSGEHGFGQQEDNYEYTAHRLAFIYPSNFHVDEGGILLSY